MYFELIGPIRQVETIAVAHSILFWALYGPFSGFPIVGGAPTVAAGLQPALKVGELAASLLIGTGGAGFLRAESRRRCAEGLLRNSRANEASQ